MKSPVPLKRYRIASGDRFRLERIDPRDTGGIRSKSEARKRLDRGLARLGELQPKLFAQDRWALLLIFQAMDAAGKDGTIRNVMSGINPQGCQVFSFKAPSREELDHDYLWRVNRCLPERGRIGIFNRSYYEEVLVVRVHPELLARQNLPQRLVGKEIWKQRFEDINAYERYLGRNGVLLRKFFLHVSPEEQKKRFLSRLDEPEKNWKFRAEDVRERRHWRAYRKAYEEMIRSTATQQAPWHVVPADHKWFTRLVVAEVVVEALESLDLRFPKMDKRQRAELVAAHRELLAE
ncbi:MAG TPA: polyphosphate kinase 2 family protein [Candidatus Polarisedimenticolia bacterium]|jgi:PPK2 family polyphosphate:nucleotide phosphotransferase|nr:polyphosphate kinase 2 family protein [Candidatus Polarisedimenticolia bacterium]